MKLALAALVAACTSDVYLGSRACDPLAGEDCACMATSDCPEQFQCIATISNTEGVCRPPANCTLADRALDCTAPPMCSNNGMSCASNADSCCAADLVCYPGICLGCCD